MIIKRLIKKSTIETMTVQRVYVKDGQPRADLINDNGVLFEGCSIMGQGGENLDFVIIPEQDQDVLTICEYGDNPYILSVFSSQEDFFESVDLLASGEHPTDKHEITNTRLKNGTTQIILSPSKIYNTSPTRIQNTLEISNGNEPSQSVAVAEPLMEDLEDYKTAINALKLQMDTLLVQLSNPAVFQGLLAPIAVVANTVNTIPNFSAPDPNDLIVSSLVKTER